MSADGADGAAERGGRRVRRRKLLYVHGFDPAPSERYRRLLARAGAERSGPPPAMGRVAPLSEVSEGWRIELRPGPGAPAVETVFEILRYEDVVRQWRNRAAPARLWAGFAALGRFAASGGLRRAAAFARAPALLLFYPPVALLGFFGGGAALGAAAGAALGGAGAAAAGAAAGLLLGFFASLRAERALFAHLMLALFEFLIRAAEGRPPAGRLEMKLDTFADRIVAAVAGAARDEVDEVLVVGHSLGAPVAIRALARAMARDVDLSGGRAALSLLTLGSVGGYLSAAGGPGAEDYAEDMIRVASDPDLFWLDVSSKRDAFCFGLVDPLLMLAEAPAAARSPRVISARFGRAAPDPDDPRTRLPAMSLHMRYLAAPDRDGAFDFLAAAAGPRTLADGFAERRDSPKARMRAR